MLDKTKPLKNGCLNHLQVLFIIKIKGEKAFENFTYKNSKL